MSVSRRAAPGAVWIALTVAACAYQPGSYRAPSGAIMAGERAAVGCLDVAVEPLPRAVPGQVVRIAFANRCDRAVPVDFPAMRATGRDATGAERSLAVFDPYGEVRALALDGRRAGAETVELVAVGAPTAALTDVCVDVAGLARADGERWVCVARTTEPVAPAGAP